MFLSRFITRMAVLFRSNPGTKPNPAKGFYTALAIFLPLIVLTMLGRSAFGALVMYGALLTAGGDVGMSYRIRALSLGLTAVGGALMTALGRVIGGLWWVEMVEIFLVVFISGLLAVYGPVADAMGLLLTISLVLSLGTRGDPATAVPSAAGFLLGGAILMLFALLFAWLQRPPGAPREEALPKRSRLALTTFAAQFTLTSPQLRFTLLRAVGAVSAAGIGLIWGGPYPYWAALPVIICTKQDRKASLMMALQNIVATVLGALLADVLIAGLQNALVLGLIVVAITFLAFTVKDQSYTLHVFFLTALLLLLISVGPSGQSFAAWRVVAISIGAGIVLVMTFLSQALFVENETSPGGPD